MNRWWDQYDVIVLEEEQLEPASCECGWSGIPIDHPKIDPLLCGHCLKGIPGTERGKEVARCPVCNSRRLVPDETACLECDWPDVIVSEPTEDLD